MTVLLHKTALVNFPMATTVPQYTDKREPRGTFPASACGLGFKKLSLGSLLSTSVTLGKTKITVEKFSVIVN